MAAIFDRAKSSTMESAGTLAAFRVFFGLFLLSCFTPSYSWMAEAPPGFFKPPVFSFARLFHDFPHPVILTLGDLFAVVSLACITAGYKTRVFGISLTCLHLILSNFSYSFGKIDHPILLWVTLLCLSFTNWGTSYCLVKDREVSLEQERAVLGLHGVLLCLGMMSAGFDKMIHWVDFDASTSGFLSWFYTGYYSIDRSYLLADHVFAIPPGFFELADYSAVAFEMLGLLFLLCGRLSWRFWLITACLFHLLNTLILNIDFISHVPVYGVYLLRLGGTFSRFKERALQKTILAVAGVLALYQLSGIDFFQEGEETLFQLIRSLLLWSFVAVMGVFSLRKDMLQKVVA